MADCELEVHCIRGMAVDISEITTANRTFSFRTLMAHGLKYTVPGLEHKWCVADAELLPYDIVQT